MQINVKYNRPDTRQLVEDVTIELLPLVEQVCREAGITLPRIAFTSRQRGCYKPTKTGGEIVINQIMAKDDTVYRKYVLCHELAHHVDYLKNMAASYPRRAEDRKSHDRIFFKTLLDVIHVFYGDVTKYPWQKEYSTLQAWARMRGVEIQKRVRRFRTVQRSGFTFAGRVYRELTVDK